MANCQRLAQAMERSSKRIRYALSKIKTSRSRRSKRYYTEMIARELMRAAKLVTLLEKLSEPTQELPAEQREFTLEELAQFNGSRGKPAYVAVNGVVYDVSLELTWGGATHFGLYAGQDLSSAFQSCHDNRLAVLTNLPKVGVLKADV